MSIAPRSWQNKSGGTETRYQVTYTDSLGKRKRRDFRKHVDAKRFVATGCGAFDPVPAEPEAPVEPVEPAVAGMLFADAAEHFVAACARGREGKPPLERSVVADYRACLRNHINPRLGTKDITTLTLKTYKAFRDDVAQMTQGYPTKRHVLHVAQAVLAHAVNEDWIASNVGKGVTIKRPKRVVPAAVKMPIHSQEEIRALLDAASRLTTATMHDKRLHKSWVRWEPMLHTLIHTGLRMSELRGLPVEALDLHARTLRVYQRADRFEQIGPPKSEHGYRTIHIPEDLCQRLRKHLGNRTSGLVFQTRTESSIQLSNIHRRMWVPCQIEAGIRVLNLHSLRHFYASMLIANKVTALELKEALGHHSAEFTMDVYGHLFQSKEDIARRGTTAEQIAAALRRGEEDD